MEVSVNGKVIAAPITTTVNTVPAVCDTEGIHDVIYKCDDVQCNCCSCQALKSKRENFAMAQRTVFGTCALMGYLNKGSIYAIRYAMCDQHIALFCCLCVVKSRFIVEGSAAPTQVLPGGTVTYTLKITSLDVAAYNCRIGPFIQPPKTKYIDDGRNAIKGVREGYVEVPMIPKNSSVIVTYRAAADDDGKGIATIFKNKTALKAEGICGTYSRAENAAASLPAICTPIQVHICQCKIVVLNDLKMRTSATKRAKSKKTVPTFYFHPDTLWKTNLQDMFQVLDLRNDEERPDLKPLTRFFMDPDDKREPKLPKLGRRKQGYPFSALTKVQDIIIRRRSGFHRCCTGKVDWLFF